ncbi:MAG: zinc ribbon domain-containing protein [Myxococcota bacterium]
MPIYEYDCRKCGTFEVSQKMSEPALTTHDVCGEPVQRRISLTSFALKGGGWYSDGYASSKKASGESAPSGSCGSGACGTGGCGAASA